MGWFAVLTGENGGNRGGHILRSFTRRADYLINIWRRLTGETAQ